MIRKVDMVEKLFGAFLFWWRDVKVEIQKKDIKIYQIKMHTTIFVKSKVVNLRKCNRQYELTFILIIIIEYTLYKYKMFSLNGYIQCKEHLLIT